MTLRLSLIFRYVLIFVMIITCQLASAQKKTAPFFDRVEPEFWWTGMKHNTVQILFYNHGTALSDFQVSTTYADIKIKDIAKVENPHYLFVTIEVGAAAKPGTVEFQFTLGKKVIKQPYTLLQRIQSASRIQGFNPSDVLYLIMPDRFANGDPTNDSLPGMYQGVHRDLPFGRHGGDIKGINDHLDFLKDLGVTTLWMNPVLENNQKRESYHGYAITDLYRVDARFGGNKEYMKLIENCHARGMKVIQDMVINHIGNEHWLMHDLPQKSWVHQFPEFTRSNYRSEAVSDPYHAESDLVKMSNGWFDTTMPDVDQTNPLFATYLIQNTIWWIEYGGLDGIRMDTYPYPDKTFMARWAEEVMTEYPDFNILGEVLVNSKPMVGYWQAGAVNKDGYKSHLPSVIDYPLTNAINAALNEGGSWDSGMSRLYTSLAHDFIYPDANGNVTFLDNHDMSRYFHNIGRDIRKYKMGLTFLLTTRGIPELYYGTEILMDGDYSIHPTVRMDYPGGWAGDKVNAFTKEGRTPLQNEAHDFLKSILNWRKHASAAHTGKLTQYIPEDNIYVYFRSSPGQTIMVIMNGNDSEKKLSTSRFAENMKSKTRATDALTGQGVNDITQIVLPPWSALILELN